MIKYNHNFAKPDENMRPLYVPIPLAVVTHHHDEWDEPMFDPDTGEPVIDPETGEQKTEHVSRDWDTTETLIHPKKADFARAGYLPVVDKPPEESAPSGSHWEPTDGYSEQGGIFRREYHAVANQPRVFSKLRIVAALMSAGVWEQVRLFIESNGLYDLYLAAQDFGEDNQYFIQGKAALQTELDWTDAQVEALLAQCVID